MACGASLRRLTLQKNRLRALPASFTRLGALQVLRADCNRIARLPRGLERCASLKDVRLDHNRLAHLEGFESRKKRSRKLDLTLYFTENSIPGLVDPVPDEVRFGSLCAHFSHVKLNFLVFFPHF